MRQGCAWGISRAVCSGSSRGSSGISGAGTDFSGIGMARSGTGMGRSGIAAGFASSWQGGTGAGAASEGLFVSMVGSSTLERRTAVSVIFRAVAMALSGSGLGAVFTVSAKAR